MEAKYIQQSSSYSNDCKNIYFEGVIMYNKDGMPKSVNFFAPIVIFGGHFESCPFRMEKK